MELKGIVDAHTHFFGPEFFRVLAESAHPRNEVGPGFARLRAAGIQVPTGTAADHARLWVKEMDRHDVDRVVSIASIPEETASLREGVPAADGRLVPFSMIDPAAPDAVARLRELVDDIGVRGLVLFPSLHHYDLADEKLEPFFAAVEKARLPVIVHMGALRVQVRDILELPSELDIGFGNPARLRKPASRHPGVTFLIPHFGGGYFDEVLALGRDLPNVHVDTSSDNSWILLQPGRLTLTEVFRRALDVLGPERIHFGTDSGAFPRGWRSDLLEEQARALEELGVSAEVQRHIFRDNTLALLSA